MPQPQNYNIELNVAL